MQFGGRYGFGSVSVRIRCICETALTRKKSELYNLDQEMSQSQNNCLSPDCKSILSVHESFSTYAYEQRCQWSVCVDAQACVFVNFLHASNTQNSHARLKYDLRHALNMEETHLFDFNVPLYLKVSTKCSNIKSTSMKISDLSVNSQKTLKWLFTVDCQ